MKLSDGKNINKMDLRYRTLKYAEWGLVIFVWLVMLMTPILFREDNDKPIMNSVLKQLEILIPLSILFLINRFILVPWLLFKGKLVLFILGVLGVILLLAYGSYIYDEKFKKYPIPRNEQTESERRPGPEPERGPPIGRQPRPVPPFANFLIFSVLVVGFDTGLRSGLRWIETENEKERLEKEHVTTQLTLLRNQVSPHFFMNTLNNIHALADTDNSGAKEAIIMLSKMMRYLLYETESERTSLKKEIEFLESYINLMKLRFSEKVKITFNRPAIVSKALIPPFLFLSFIENAFKYGISYKNDSFVFIDLVTGNDRLLFMVKNSKNGKGRLEEFSGIGIENTRKRLDLLFGNTYHLDILDNEDSFTVNLSFPL
jgi:hypothetical protein